MDINVILNYWGVVTANGSSGAPEKNGNDVILISSIQNPVSVISTIGDIYPKTFHVIVRNEAA